MIDIKIRELEIQLARCRHLMRQVTDPLAEHLLKVIAVDLEGDLNSMLPDCPVKLEVPGGADKEEGLRLEPRSGHFVRI